MAGRARAGDRSSIVRGTQAEDRASGGRRGGRADAHGGHGAHHRAVPGAALQGRGLVALAAHMPPVDDRRETTEPHSRLLRCSLCIDESRAYWSQVDPDAPRVSSVGAFEASWFGTKSEAWTTELLSNMRVRFDAFPDALRVLARWRSMTPETRRL